MAHESSTMLSLRGVQHKDRFGNLISAFYPHSARFPIGY